MKYIPGTIKRKNISVCVRVYIYILEIKRRNLYLRFSMMI